MQRLDNMRRKTKAAACLGTFAILAGCDTFGLQRATCTTDVRPGILLTVRDSVTGNAVRGLPLVIAADGTFADTFKVRTPSVDPDTLLTPQIPLAHERAGVYRVDITHRAYRPWTQSGVRVNDGDCHVQTVNLTARLRPL
jgi:hypothetical protein